MRAERVLGSEAVSWTRVVSGGWTRNEHWTLGLADGTLAFAKVASIDPSPAWLRDERHVYSCVSGPFMPRLLGWEDGEQPLLLLEDLADAYWPPPWRDGDVDAVLEVLAAVAATAPTGELPAFTAEGWPGWRDVEHDPSLSSLSRPRLGGVAGALAAGARCGERPRAVQRRVAPALRCAE